jgi:hypothetical protein
MLLTEEKKMPGGSHKETGAGRDRELLKWAQEFQSE